MVTATCVKSDERQTDQSQRDPGPPLFAASDVGADVEFQFRTLRQDSDIADVAHQNGFLLSLKQLIWIQSVTKRNDAQGSDNVNNQY